jgi:hypothetical protein
MSDKSQIQIFTIFEAVPQLLLALKILLLLRFKALFAFFFLPILVVGQPHFCRNIKLGILGYRSKLTMRSFGIAPSGVAM